jgi:RNA binding exosome subunit
METTIILDSSLVQDLTNYKEVTSRYICDSAKISASNSSVNHLFNAFINAYNTHSALKLSPDHILIAIGQTVSTFINNNPETFRDRFVTHDGSHDIKIIQDKLQNQSDINRLFESFQKELKSETKTNLVDLLTPNFTTTTTISKIVGTLTVMSTFKEFFKYYKATMCGISAVTLSGTDDDWEQLLDKYVQIKTLIPELSAWYIHFDKIIQLFMDMRYYGNSDDLISNNIKKIWKKCVSIIPKSSGQPMSLAGWIRLFYPFNSKNKLISIPDDWNALEPSDMKIPDNVINEINNVNKVYIRWQDIQPSIIEVDIIIDMIEKKVHSGIIGTTYDGKHFVPVIGYKII